MRLGGSSKVASEAKNREHLIPLSDLGHFLKGSSAAIGAKHVKELCERAQHYGHCRDEEVEEDLSLEEALKRFDPLLKDLDQEINKAESWLVRVVQEPATEHRVEYRRSINRLGAENRVGRGGFVLHGSK